jgi:rare lipoprotein A
MSSSAKSLQRRFLRTSASLPAAKSVVLAALAGGLLAGCSTVSRREPPPAPVPLPAPAPPAKPDVATVPDAVPRYEPRSKRGNPAFYEVLGRRYSVLATADGYLERGVASWYGPTFHGAPTSMGEKYDMYAMTAAHKTLPLPAYARVTNLSNGKSVVVRVNDRGPFVANRIIDLSYTAAAKLDMLREGTTMVEVRTLTPGQPDPLTRGNQQPPQRLFVQAGAFSDPANARRLADRLQANGVPGAFVTSPPDGRSGVFRVRAGPVDSVREFDDLVGKLKALGITDARLAE